VIANTGACRHVGRRSLAPAPRPNDDDDRDGHEHDSQAVDDISRFLH
jgi:hypothetical protein